MTVTTLTHPPEIAEHPELRTLSETTAAHDRDARPIVLADGENASPALLILELAIAYRAYHELLSAALATIAAADRHTRHDPTSWLREHLDARGLAPAPGAKPTDYMPIDPREAAFDGNLTMTGRGIVIAGEGDPDDQTTLHG